MTLNPADDAPVHVDQRARMEILAAILLTMFLSALDQTVVGTALPRIVTDLRGNELYTWVVTVYLLTATVSGPIYGKLSDQFGRRPMIMIGVSLFLIGSLLCGLSQEMWQLILFRGLQGVGAGAIFPISLAVIGDLFSPRERGKYQGLFGAVFALSSLLGPALGGFLTDTISWHWVFLVNLPLGILALFVLWRLLPSVSHPERVRSIDYPGAAVFTAALVPFLLGLTNAQTGEWTDPQVGGLILLGLALGAVFVWVESRAAEPILPLSLFRNRTVTASIIATFFITFGFFGAIIFIPRWFQFVAGSSATESGYQMLPLMVGVMGSSILSGYLVARTGRYKWMTAGAMAIGAVGIGLMTNLRADTEITTLWIWMLVAGLGIGPSFAVFTIVVQSAVAPSMLGAATSALTFFRQVGGSVGLAIAGTVFGTALTDQLPQRMAANGIPQPMIDAFVSQGGGNPAGELTGVGTDLGAQILNSVPAQVRPSVEPFIGQIVDSIYQAFSLAIANTMWLGLAGAVLSAAVVALLVPELTLRRATGGSGGGQAGGERQTTPIPTFE
ncbi:MAG TPA: MDR family MFS transporter [Candidatus Limnocylindria bacterium]|jgi:EmrB/QacA subfamily drug resistance transporter|nr:MDR family MFS transporter [Candidatus Limnocylindria bacterium]